MTYAMPEAEPWQIVVFGLAVAGILTAGLFISRPRKPNPPKAEPLHSPINVFDPYQELEQLCAQPWAPQAAAEWERYWEDVGGNSDVLAKIRFFRAWNACVLGKRKDINLPYIGFIGGNIYHYRRSFSELVGQ